MKSMLTTCALLIALLASSTPCNAEVARKRAQQQPTRTAVYDYGPLGPNRSYRPGPATRIYVSKRSWLDGGTEVLPGERKFSDYALPPNASFARDNGNRQLDRQPLSTATDISGFGQRVVW